MSVDILLAPVGAGKTEVVLDRLTALLAQQPLARVWVLLASRRQQDAFRERLVQRTGIAFNVEFFNFYELYQRLLDLDRQPQRLISETARLALLRELLRSLRPQLEVYHTIADRPGLARIVIDFIDELKQNQVQPEDFAAAAATPRDHDLALIYRAYQQRLIEHRLADREGQGWLAVEALDRNRQIVTAVDWLIVDGFDQFTPVQAALLAELSAQVTGSLVTLTTIPTRQHTAGRRFAAALDRLRWHFDRRGVPYREETLAASMDAVRHIDLQRLVADIFQPGPPVPSSGGLALLEAPDPAAEVGAVLRHVKRLLLAGDGTTPDDILIVLRDWERYRVHFSALGRQYNLPLALHYGEPLAENPAIVALLDVLRLHEIDFRRRELLDVLRSPYFKVPGVDAAAADLLDRLARQMLVIGGRQAWLDTLAFAGQPLADEDGEPVETTADAQQLADLRVALADFFDAVTPPPQADMATYVAWLEKLLGADPHLEPEPDELAEAASYSLNLLACLRDDHAPLPVIARDITAAQEFKRALRGLLAAEALARGMFAAADLTWDDFQAALLAAVGRAAVNPRPDHSGRVLVTSATDARGLPHRHVFILGLSEGIFPTRTPEDPLYLDSERRALRAAGLTLDSQAERSADDGLFYELICLPRDTLICSRPTLDNGELWPASALWQAVTAVFADSDALIARDRLKVGRTLPAAGVATRAEAAIAVAADSASDSPAARWLRVHQPAYWQHIREAAAVERDRLDGASRYPQHNGRLNQPHLIERVAALLGPSRQWSASQLNDYGVCGFRFFAGRLLGLESLVEPEIGMDAAQFGSINHAILEQTYRYFQERELPIVPANLELALEQLEIAAHDVFADAPMRFGFRPSATWPQEQQVIRRRLRALVEQDFSDSPLNKLAASGDARVPYQLEAAFGYFAGQAPGTPVSVHLSDEAGSLRVRGFIDRIDLVGDRLYVVDYKSGSTKIDVKELAEGRNFQMMVYLEAIRALAARMDEPLRVGGGLFWHIGSRETSGAMTFSDGEPEEIAMARQHLAGYITAARRGDFATHANRPQQGRCVSYCEFSQLCRISNQRRA